MRIRARAVLFDLDDTLVPDRAAALAAFRAAAELARPRGAEPDDVVASAKEHARCLWAAFRNEAGFPDSRISSWEVLYADLGGNDPGIALIRPWAPGFRIRVWRLALADSGITDPGLARRLSRAYRQERLARFVPYPDALPALEALAPRFRLGLVTNGAPENQRDKLGRTGLARFFSAVVISGEVGVWKPEPGIYRHALAQLDVRAGDAVMVGDKLGRDVGSARAAGLRGVWLNRPGGEPRDADTVPDARIEGLDELPPLLEPLPA